jgi:nonsense-mediated mRNA decay protein 3
MRLKVRVSVQTVVENVTIQQRVPVEFQIKWKMCDKCDREYTNRTWHAVVQLRQKRDDTGRSDNISGLSSSSSSRKGLVALEMALSKSKDIRKNVLKIDTSRHGLDFYFLTLPQAQQFTQFLQRLAPMKIKTSSKLVSTDTKNNTANMKHTLTCDMVPLCKDDLVLVQKSSRTPLQGRLGLVTKVASVVHIVDASPKRTGRLDSMDLTADGYHKGGGAEKGFTVIQTGDRMTRFVVLDVELIDSSSDCNNHDESSPSADSLCETPASGVEKYGLANVEVARESDLGANDEVLHCVTHLGRLIQPGDVVWGYDLISNRGSLTTTATGISTGSAAAAVAATTGGVVDLEDVINSNVVLQDVVLVKKITTKGQRELTDAADDALAHDNTRIPTGDDDNDDDDGKSKKKGKRSTKKKERRQLKLDRKQRELEESAKRMGFIDDLEERRAAYGDWETSDDDNADLDVDYAAELEEVERQLAMAFPNNDTPSAPADQEANQTSEEEQ